MLPNPPPHQWHGKINLAGLHSMKHIVLAQSFQAFLPLCLDQVGIGEDRRDRLRPILPSALTTVQSVSIRSPM
jgi:hypothetical protein